LRSEKIIIFNRLPFGFDYEAKSLIKSIARGTYHMFQYIDPNPLDNFLEFGKSGIFIIPQLFQYVATEREINPKDSNLVSWEATHLWGCCRSDYLHTA
jgi:hypothetical protein